MIVPYSVDGKYYVVSQREPDSVHLYPRSVRFLPLCVKFGTQNFILKIIKIEEYEKLFSDIFI